MIPDNTDTNPWDGFLLEWKQFVKDWNNFWQGVKDFFSDNWWILVAVGVLLALGILSIFFPVLRIVFKVIWIGIKLLFKILWYIVSAPVRLVVLLINKAKAKKEGSG